MVRVQGPLFSHRAAGAFAKAIIYRGTQRGTTAYPYFKPAQPMTLDQLNRREMFGWLTELWPNLSTAEQDSWHELLPYHCLEAKTAYLVFNLHRWSHFQAPLRKYTFGFYAAAPEPTWVAPIPGHRHIRWRFNAPAMPNDAGFVLFRSQEDGFERGDSKAAAIFWRGGPDPRSIVDSNLDPGTYYAQISTFNGAGVWTHHDPQKTATVE